MKDCKIFDKRKTEEKTVKNAQICLAVFQIVDIGNAGFYTVK